MHFSHPQAESTGQGVRQPRLAAAQCTHLVRSAGLLALAQLLACAACAWLLRGRVDAVELDAWLLAAWLAQALGLPLWLKGLFAGAETAPANAALHGLLRAGSLLSGSLWGLIAWRLLPGDPALAGLLGLLVASLCGVVVAAIGVDAVAALGFCGCVLLPMALRLGAEAAAQARLQAVIGVAYLPLLAWAAWAAQRRLDRALAWREQAARETARRERQARRARRMAEWSTMLAEMLRLGAQADDRQEFEQAVCRIAVQRGGASQAWLARAQAAGAALQPVARVQRPGSALPPLGREQAEQALRERQPCLRAGQAPQAGPPTQAGPPLRQGYSLAALPLHGQEPRGDGADAVLVLVFDEAEVFDQPATQVLAQVSAALERGLQLLAQRGRMAQLQSLYHALMSEGEVLLQARTVPDMLLRTCQTLTEGTPFHCAWMARPDEQGRIQIIARAGSGAEQLDSLRISLHDRDRSPLVLRVWTSHRDACCNDLLGDPVMAPWRDSMAAHAWRSALATPVLREGSLWAVLVFVSPQAHAFDQQTSELCRRVAELLGRGLDELETKRRLNELQQEESYRARHDLLTGLPNRFALTQYLPQALAAARRDGSVLAVGLIDLDDFKPVNDTWGHDAGDRLLGELGRRLRAAIRKFDVLVRLGGDEFVVVIEQIDSERVLEQLGDVLRRLYDAAQRPFDIASDCQARVGLSMGLALYPLDADDPDSLLREADAAMYRAKLHKQDRARWWQLAAASHARLQGQPQRAPPQLQVVGGDAAGAAGER